MYTGHRSSSSAGSPYGPGRWNARGPIFLILPLPQSKRPGPIPGLDLCDGYSLDVERRGPRAEAANADLASFLPLAQASSAPLTKLYACDCKSVHCTGGKFRGFLRVFRAGRCGTRAVNPFHRAIYLTGPTASGKTAVGVALARRLGAEVIALDSMTLYRGMDIGTAKPTPAERGGVPHHLIDVLDPWESASVADYRRLGAAAVVERSRRGASGVLFVGGTAPVSQGPAARPVRGAGGRPRACGCAWRRRPTRTATRPCTSGSRASTRRPPRGSTPTTGGGSSGPWRSSSSTGRPLSGLQVEHARPAPPGVAGLRARAAPGRAARPDQPPGRRDVRRRAWSRRSARLQAARARSARSPRRGWAIARCIEHARRANDRLGRDDRAGPGPDPAVRQAAGHLVPRPGRGPPLAGGRGR